MPASASRRRLPDHHGVPYSLTEDFVTVYRLHPLIPDDYRFARPRDRGAARTTAASSTSRAPRPTTQLRSFGLDNLLYSFGIAHPGAITLHNLPAVRCSAFERDGERIDLSVVDLVRTRRRGSAALQRLPGRAAQAAASATWSELSDDPESVRRMREVYRSVDDVDTMVGLFAETPPEGFGFSDTAFRIFILMASRRLQSDRFLTVDFRPEIYSPFGMDWIASNGMTSVILRHCPDLAAVLPRGRSAFAPWRPAEAAPDLSGAMTDQHDRPADRPTRSRRRPGGTRPAPPLVDADAGPPHPPGQPGQLGRGGLDELHLERAARPR